MLQFVIRCVPYSFMLMGDIKTNLQTQSPGNVLVFLQYCVEVKMKTRSALLLLFIDSSFTKLFL